MASAQTARVAAPAPASLLKHHPLGLVGIFLQSKGANLERSLEFIADITSLLSRVPGLLENERFIPVSQHDRSRIGDYSYYYDRGHPEILRDLYALDKQVLAILSEFVANVPSETDVDEVKRKRIVRNLIGVSELDRLMAITQEVIKYSPGSAGTFTERLSSFVKRLSGYSDDRPKFTGALAEWFPSWVVYMSGYQGREVETAASVAYEFAVACVGERVSVGATPDCFLEAVRLFETRRCRSDKRKPVLLPKDVFSPFVKNCKRINSETGFSFFQCVSILERAHGYYDDSIIRDLNTVKDLFALKEEDLHFATRIFSEIVSAEWWMEFVRCLRIHKETLRGTRFKDFYDRLHSSRPRDKTTTSVVEFREWFNGLLSHGRLPVPGGGLTSLNAAVEATGAAVPQALVGIESSVAPDSD